MARPKEFDQHKALRQAVRLFSRQGFAATSTDELMQAMGIGRQSMYATFGDKRALFMKALEHYVTESCNAILAELQKQGPPLQVISNALLSFAERKDMSSEEGCMGLNALSEFGQRDAEVTQTIRADHSQRETVIRLLKAAQERGELQANEVIAAADFFDSTLAGIRMAAKAGKSRKALREMAAFAAKALTIGVGKAVPDLDRQSTPRVRRRT